MDLTDQMLFDFGFTKEPQREGTDYPEQFTFTKDGFSVTNSVTEGRKSYFTFINGHARFFSTSEEMIKLYKEKTGKRVFK